MPKLLSSLPVGAVVKDTGTTYNGQPILFKVMEHGHAGDPAGSTALVTKNIITLKCFDAIEARNSDNNRKQYGNNRWLHANLRQWLNSTAAAGAWYAAQHTADEPPTNANVYSNYNEYDKEAGFLMNFSEKMRAALLTVTKRVAKNTVTDGGSYEDVTDKIFCLSNTEVGLANENSVAEGSIYVLFNTASERMAYPTAEAVSRSEYKNEGLAASKTWYYWLRTPYAGYSYNARYVYTDGTLNGYHAYYGGIGVRPACAVSSSIFVSDEAGADGAYTIIWNSAPTITTDGADNLGDKNIPFAVNYTITDADNDKVTVVVKLDAETVQTLDSVVLGDEYRLNISGTKLNQLANGAHTITITAQDSYKNTNTKTVTFNKTAASVAISGTDRTIGNWWTLPQYEYTVTDTEGEQITVTESVDGETTNTVENAGQKGTISFKIDEVFKTLDNENTHTLTIKAVNADGAEAYRNITFTKLAENLCFETKPIETDAAAEKIIVNIDYDKQGSPGLKVEVTNCTYNGAVVWEDATKEVVARKAYSFKNTVFDNKRFGVAVRVTITKNINTERVYCNSLGFCFD